MLLSTFTGQHTVPHDLRYNTQEKHMMEVAWAILELLSMFDGRCLQAGLVTKQGIVFILIPPEETAWPLGDPVMVTRLQQKLMLCISNMSGLKHEAALSCSTITVLGRERFWTVNTDDV